MRACCCNIRNCVGIHVTDNSHESWISVRHRIRPTVTSDTAEFTNSQIDVFVLTHQYAVLLLSGSFSGTYEPPTRANK